MGKHSGRIHSIRQKERNEAKEAKRREREARRGVEAWEPTCALCGAYADGVVITKDPMSPAVARPKCRECAQLVANKESEIDG